MCGKPLCTDCSVRCKGEIVCEESSHKEVVELWAFLVRSNSEFEADMIVGNLRIEDIGVRRYSSRAFKSAIGENTWDVVQVYVRQEDLSRAQDILRDLDLPTADSLPP